MQNVMMIILQAVVVGLLFWHGRSYHNQLKEARRDEIIRIRIQLGDIYMRYLNEMNEVLKSNLREQMSYLSRSYDEVSKHLKDTQDDGFLEVIRDECKRSDQYECDSE